MSRNNFRMYRKHRNYFQYKCHQFNVSKDIFLPDFHDDIEKLTTGKWSYDREVLYFENTEDAVLVKFFIPSANNK